jgi:uncharacterized repeat protein (TIGR03803 family)
MRLTGVDMDMSLPGTMKMPMKTTRAIFGVLKITFGFTGRICTSSLGPLRLLLLILPVWGAQAAVVFTSLYSFTGGDDGVCPTAALVQGSDGNFYGTTYGDGVVFYGTVFRISTNGALTSLYSFTGGNDGAYPYAALVQGSDGYFYGTTSSGGTNGDEFNNGGTVFKINSNGALRTLYAFGTITNANGDWLDGNNPNGLVQGSDRNFYGTTWRGGTNGCGTVFKISTNGALTTLHSFTGGGDGGYPTYPTAALVQGNDGNFYGTTAGGGTNDNGTVFRMSTNGALTSLYSLFNGGGIYPSGLVQGSDGYFYGTTREDESLLGCALGNGTVFKISTNGAFSSLYSFDNGTNGAWPEAALVQGSDGSFYGTTSCDRYSCMDGRCGFGTVFRISTNGALTSLYWFDKDNGTNGGWPEAALVQGSDGSFYGTTFAYGNGPGWGTVFRLTIVPDPQLTIIPSESYVILTWPTNYAGFTLQSTTNLGSSAVWTPVSPKPVVIGGQTVAINTISGTQQFYRLSR